MTKIDEIINRIKDKEEGRKEGEEKFYITGFKFRVQIENNLDSKVPKSFITRGYFGLERAKLINRELETKTRHKLALVAATCSLLTAPQEVANREAKATQQVAQG